MPRTYIPRTPAEKADHELSWARPDEEFFAAGACHVLAAAFLIAYPAAGFGPWRIRPSGARGAHMVVLREDVVFDWMGYSVRDVFLREYSEAMRGVCPGWVGDFQPVAADPIGWGFCRAVGWRHPSQFAHDPLPRALAYLRRFAPPMEGTG